MKRILVQAPLPDSFRRFAWTNVLDLSPVKKLSSVNQSDYQALGKHTLDSLINGSKPLAEEVEEMLQKGKTRTSTNATSSNPPNPADLARAVPSAGGYRCPPPLLPSSPSRERERCQTRDRKIS